MSDDPQFDRVISDFIERHAKKLRAMGDWHHPEETEWMEAMELCRKEIESLRARLSAAEAERDARFAVLRERNAELNELNVQASAALARAERAECLMHEAQARANDSSMRHKQAEARLAGMEGALRDLSKLTHRHSCHSCGLTDEESAEVRGFNEAVDMVVPVARAALGEGKG